eukprot:gnl/TRDRNA2_/TRDRNA2_130794_c0_seq1.p1 gnl/TRDRNA2_/TRDRNA2_130794_c0~~gnl/TRDRNA2_/TRDRNA2_130794_c0_seq1.p1  ORF type:complete len:623 (+),score=70.34 gnl/TRDRNA2_/TRDRNA2_130794_c0_seq1:51-1919(+)
MALRVVAIVVAIARHGDGSSPMRPVAGTGRGGFGGTTYGSQKSDFAVESKLNSPWGLALDTTFDLLYIADTLNNVVRSLDLQTGLLEVIAGTGHPGYSGDGFTAATAKLQMPTGLALDVSRQVLYISDTSNHRVRKVELKVGKVYQAEDEGVTSTTTRIDGPEKILSCPGQADPSITPVFMGNHFCAGATGSGYVTYLQSIKDKIDWHVTATQGAGQYELRFRYADRYDEVSMNGNRRMRLYVNDVVLTHALEFVPTGLPSDGTRETFEWVVWPNANLVAGENVVRLEVVGLGGPYIDMLYVVPLRPAIQTVLGTGTASYVDDVTMDMLALVSPVHSPLGLAIDETNNWLYVADADNGRVRRVDIASGMVRTIAGGGGTSRDGSAATAGKIFRPVGLALDSAKEYLYVSDGQAHQVRRVDLTTRPIIGGTVITICGFGIRQAPFELQLNSPVGIELDNSGTLFVADKGNSWIKSVDLTSGACPSHHASRQECAYAGASQATCTSLGCCFDPAHEDCANPINQDGRESPGPFTPEDVVTKVDGRLDANTGEERSRPISFVNSRSDRCCYPKYRHMTTLDVLDSPQGLAWDHRDGSLFVAQPKQHRVVKFLLSEGRCASGEIAC